MTVFLESSVAPCYLPRVAFTRPGTYSRGKIDASGRTLVKVPVWQDDLDEALDIVNHWRLCHSFPLQSIKMTLRRRAKKVFGKALVAQRLKRLQSIMEKLKREEGMQLARMQDIGGCRAVVRTTSQLDRLIRIYTKSNAKSVNRGPEFVKLYDYVWEPKPDGYRSIHLVYKYRSKLEDYQCWNGLRIEIQIRTQLQHAWATAVETVSTFTGQRLKSQIGDDSWKRFFALMGTAIALKEKRNPVPNTPHAKDELVKELRQLEKELDLLTTLLGWNTAVHVTQPSRAEAKGAHVFLLTLDIESKTIEVQPYRKSQTANASDAYLKVEKEIHDKLSRKQAVLVSASSLAELRRAYPSYYMDTTEFIELVRGVIAE